jgi:hypothetical protein
LKLEPDRVVAELAAWKPRPLDGVLALLDMLLRRALLIVKDDDPFSWSHIFAKLSGWRGRECPRTSRPPISPPTPLVAGSEAKAAVILRAIDELHRTEPGAGERVQ